MKALELPIVYRYSNLSQQNCILFLKFKERFKAVIGKMKTRLTVPNALDDLAKTDSPFKELFTHGSLSVEIYKPEIVDKQTPHSRDEIYVIASGSGSFVVEGQRQDIEVGEVLFVAAGKDHRFLDFSEDFSTWVFFYGPEGGESN